MRVDVNQIAQFIGKYLATGLVLYFGWQIGAWLDRFVPNLPS